MERKKVAILLFFLLLSVLSILNVGKVVSKTDLEHVIYDESAFKKTGTSKEDVEAYMMEMREKIKSLYSKRAGEKSASGLPDDVKRIVKVELVLFEKVSQEKPDMVKGFTEEEKKFCQGKYMLKIIFDNGKVHWEGPCTTMPSRIEIGNIKVLGKPKKVLIVEE